MLKKILIVIIPLLALIGGAAAGDFLAPKPEAAADGAAEGAAHASPEADAAEAGHGGKAGETKGHDAPSAESGETESGGHGAPAKSSGGHGGAGDENAAAWFSFPNQFFVPVVQRGEIAEMMVLTLTIETTAGAMPVVEAHEHRLRDALLRSLIIHANTGGFTGNYTAEAKLQRLRDSLLAAATKASGPEVHAVLIEDIGKAGG